MSLAPYGLNIDCIIENLNEENGDLSQKGFKSYPHKKLYNLFLEELTDHTKNSIKTNYISEVHDWHKEILEISKTSFASGVGALGIGNELVVPQIYQNILKGLNTSKKFSKRAIFFFELHSECDVKHSEDFINISIKISNKYENLRDLNNGVKKMLFLREKFCDKILMNFNEKTETIYNKNADFWSRNKPLSLSDFTARDYLFKYLGKLNNLKIADIGCGEGYCSREFIKFGAKHHYWS